MSQSELYELVLGVGGDSDEDYNLRSVGRNGSTVYPRLAHRRRKIVVRSGKPIGTRSYSGLLKWYFKEVRLTEKHNESGI